MYRISITSDYLNRTFFTRNMTNLPPESLKSNMDLSGGLSYDELSAKIEKLEDKLREQKQKVKEINEIM